MLSCPWHAPKVAMVFYLLPAPLSDKKLLVVIQNGVHTSTHIDQRPTPLDSRWSTRWNQQAEMSKNRTGTGFPQSEDPDRTLWQWETYWLMVYLPLWNILVSWDYEIPKWENKNHVPNQKMAMGNLLHNFWPTKFNHPNGLRSQTLDP